MHRRAPRRLAGTRVAGTLPGHRGPGVNPLIRVTHIVAPLLSFLYAARARVLRWHQVAPP